MNWHMYTQLLNQDLDSFKGEIYIQIYKKILVWDLTQKIRKRLLMLKSWYKKKSFNCTVSMIFDITEIVEKIKNGLLKENCQTT